MGETQASWAKNGHTPAQALGKLQIKSGAFDKRHNTATAPLATTSWALMALRNQTFTKFPKSRPAALKPFAYRVALKTIAPKDHTKFTTTRIVLIRATYADGAGGTGVDAKACRLYVDNVNRSKAAAIGPYGLHLELKNVPDGAHTYELRLVDYAGNVRLVQRSFTVAVPVAPTTPTTPSEPYVPTTEPTYGEPTHTPTPSTTLFPASPSPSTSASPLPGSSAAPVTGQPVASPSPSASPGAAGTGGRERRR